MLLPNTAPQPRGRPGAPLGAGYCPPGGLGCVARVLLLLSCSSDRPPPNKRLQLTPNSPRQSIRGTVLAAGAVPRR
jgi:hypothetical protein